MKIELLEESFAAVAPLADQLADTFYQTLFEDFPAVKPLFASVKFESQKKKLIASLKLVVNHLRRPEELVAALENLGSRHVDYGAVDAHYPAVGQTLLKSLAAVAGSQWTQEYHDAWEEAYGEITKIMLRGAMQPAV